MYLKVIPTAIKKPILSSPVLHARWISLFIYTYRELWNHSDEAQPGSVLLFP